MSKEVSASGFVAGTLVHTDKGLVPIEQLKVGDMVLSKHESGEGEQAYKRVVNTFKSAEKLPIVSVSFNDLSNRLGSMRLFCTDNHPFWNPISKEWTPAKDLRFNSHVVLYDLNDKIVGLDDDAGYLVKTAHPQVALCSYLYHVGRRSNFGMLVDFRQNNPLLVIGKEGFSEFEFGWYGMNWDRSLHPDENTKVLSEFEHPDTQFYFNAYDESERRPSIIDAYDDPDSVNYMYTDYDYNIEVEDFHTYYVGKAGIWVHNSNTCLNLGVFPSTPKVTQP